MDAAEPELPRQAGPGSVHHPEPGQKGTGPELPVPMMNDSFDGLVPVLVEHAAELCVGIPGAEQELFLEQASVKHI